MVAQTGADGSSLVAIVARHDVLAQYEAVAAAQELAREIDRDVHDELRHSRRILLQIRLEGRGVGLQVRLDGRRAADHEYPRLGRDRAAILPSSAV
jgi:hypothetical protein